MVISIIILAAGIAVLCSAQMPARKLQNIKVIEIKSGDTFLAERATPPQAEKQNEVTINLAGIKAPPSDSLYGREAVKYLKDRLLGHSVNAEYDRPMDGWRVKLSGYDVSEELIKRGLVYRNNDQDVFKKAEAYARNNRQGMWKERPLEDSQKRKGEVPVYDYDAHTVPEYFHDISDEVNQKNYVQQRPQYVPGQSYSLTISGDDSFYERATSPRTIFVHSSSRKDAASLMYVIAGMDIRLIDKMRPGEFKSFDCTFLRMVDLRNWYGAKQAPLFSFEGKSDTLGVGGEIMHRQ
jgi:endonuclease YncB( thermonuclease family)